MKNSQIKDIKTAEAFATSWNNLPKGSVYTFDQFCDWFAPLNNTDIKQKNILELGCGNASLLVHATKWEPESLTGIDLGESVLSAQSNMKETGYSNYKIIKDDLTTFRSEEKFDLAYSIGVLHHLKNPHEGFISIIENTKDKGSFHCWVYAKEGNALIIYVVDPIRKITSKLPWWISKYLIATPLSFIYLFIYLFLYAHFITFF